MLKQIKRKLLINCLVGLLLALFIVQLNAHAEPIMKHMVIFRLPETYASHPALRKGSNEQLWVNFDTNTIRTHYGQAEGGVYKTLVAYSPDHTASWYISGRDKGFKSSNPDDVALKLQDGGLISVEGLVNEVVPRAEKEELKRKGVFIKKEWENGSASVSYRISSSKRGVDGAWTRKQIALPSVALIQTLKRGIVTKDGTIMIPAYGRLKTTDPAMRAMFLRSTDNGNEWQLITAAYDGFHNFAEPDVIQTPDGKILCMMRCDSNKDGAEGQKEEGYLWQAISEDDGQTWGTPQKTSMWGYPPDLMQLKDGRLLCTYGYRRSPFGIRATFSHDNGRTWDTNNEIILRNDALSIGKKARIGDLGYPSTVQLTDGSLFTVYYLDLGDGVTHIAGTHWILKPHDKIP